MKKIYKVFDICLSPLNTLDWFIFIIRNLYFSKIWYSVSTEIQLYLNNSYFSPYLREIYLIKILSEIRRLVW